MSRFDNRVAKMTADLADRTAAIETERAVMAAEQAEKRAAGVRVLCDVAMPLIEEVRTSCDAQRIKYALSTEFDGVHDPRITFQCNGRKTRADGSTYIVDGAELLISHDGEALCVKVRRYPMHQKGPAVLVDGSESDRVMAGIEVVLNSYFIAITPDKS